MDIRDINRSDTMSIRMIMSDGDSNFPVICTATVFSKFVAVLKPLRTVLQREVLGSFSSALV